MAKIRGSQYRSQIVGLLFIVRTPTKRDPQFVEIQPYRYPYPGLGGRSCFRSEGVMSPRPGRPFPDGPSLCDNMVYTLAQHNTIPTLWSLCKRIRLYASARKEQAYHDVGVYACTKTIRYLDLLRLGRACGRAITGFWNRFGQSPHFQIGSNQKAKAAFGGCKRSQLVAAKSRDSTSPLNWYT